MIPFKKFARIQPLKFLALVLLAAALLAGCGPAAPTSLPAGGEPTQANAAPAQNGYPMENAYPALEPQQNSAGEPGSYWLAYPVMPGDEALERGNFFVEAIRITPIEGMPGNYQLDVDGSLPTPCNQPRVQLNPPNAENRVEIEVYSLLDTGMACTQVLQPFSGTIATLSGYPTGTYTVIVNGEDAGQIVMP